LDEKIAKYDSVVQAKANNKLLEAEIETLQALIKTYKLSMHGQQTQLMSLAADVRLLGNAMDDKVKKLNEVKTGDKMYKLYSIYLQAVERSGIPAMVIKKRLPMLNNKINSILQTIVGFKMEFSIDMKGNITELFYNTESKWDALPLNSGSGSQQFIASIAIKDALNYVSKRSIVQPSIMMIDEGFGTLGNELRENIMTMLEYLKGKYQNVVIITHLDEVKEGADHVIEAIRDRNIIMDSAHDRDERAGVTRLHVRR
jgi:exonuclease SbcC